MMWFKNVIIYQLSKEINWDKENLENKLRACACHPCGKHDMSNFGWIQPLATGEELCFCSGDNIYLLAQEERKILPNDVLQRTLAQKLVDKETKEERKLSKVERAALKEDIIHELLPRAFSRYQYTNLFINVKLGLIYVNTCSYVKAERVLALLRKSLGSLPVLPLQFNKDLSATLTSWLISDKLPSWLELQKEVELVSVQNDSTVIYKNQDLTSRDIEGNLLNGRLVKKLALSVPNTVDFVLHADSRLKRLHFCSEIKEKNNDIPRDDIRGRFEADFHLMSSALGIIALRLCNGN